MPLKRAIGFGLLLALEALALLSILTAPALAGVEPRRDNDAPATSAPVVRPEAHSGNTEEDPGAVEPADAPDDDAEEGPGRASPAEAEDPPRGEQPGPRADPERIVVRAAAPNVVDVTAFATTIDAREARVRAIDLGDLLRRIPGARVRDYGGLGAYSTVSLRASTSEQVVVLLDGVPQNRALGGPVDLSSIPATLVDTVTVFRGFAPAVYGLGGIGGLVDVRTEDPGGTSGRIDLLAGELGAARLAGGAAFATDAHGRLRIGVEALQGNGRFEWLDTGGTPFDPSDDTSRLRENNDVEQRSVLLRHARDRVGGGNLGLALRLEARDRGVPGVDGFPLSAARLEESLFDLSGAWTRPAQAGAPGVDLLADGFRQQIDFRDPDGTVAGVQDRSTRLAGGGLAAVVRLVRGRQSFTVRGDLRHESAGVHDATLDVPDRGGAARDLFAIAVEDTWSHGRLVVAPSLRWESRHDDFNGSPEGTVPPPAEDVRQEALSGKVGLAWQLGPRTMLRGSIGRFHRSPSLLELFGDRGPVAGNPGLRAESGDAIEVGAAGRRGERLAWEWEAVGFARRADDLIRFVPASQGTAVARNIAAARVHGLELSGTLAAPAGFSALASVTWQRATDDSGGFADGEPLPYQPAWLAYAGLGYGRGGFVARWEMNYTGRNTTTVIDIPEFRMPERLIHDVWVSYGWYARYRLGIDVANVFDRRTRDLARYPLPGRAVSLTFGWSSAP